MQSDNLTDKNWRMDMASMPILAHLDNNRYKFIKDIIIR